MLTHRRDNATVTQSAEYLFCKQKVVGSSPTSGPTLLTPMDTQEEWKPVPIKQFEGLYDISSHGRLRACSKTTSDGRRLPERFVKPTKLRNGYLQFKLHNNKFRFNVNSHKLVAITFGLIYWNEHSSSELQINHKDGNKENNSVSNLEACTPSENLLHAYRTGLKKPSNRYG
jgi:hypothetical protein